MRRNGTGIKKLEGMTVNKKTKLRNRGERELGMSGKKELRSYDYGQ